MAITAPVPRATDFLGIYDTLLAANGHLRPLEFNTAAGHIVCIGIVERLARDVAAGAKAAREIGWVELYNGGDGFKGVYTSIRHVGLPIPVVARGPEMAIPEMFSPAEALALVSMSQLTQFPPAEAAQVFQQGCEHVAAGWVMAQGDGNASGV